MRALMGRLLLFLPVMAIVVGVNALVDPGNVLGKGEAERRLAGDLLAGRRVRVARHYDEMLLQRRYAEGLPRAVDVLVLGSSRAMPVSQEAFPGRRVWNGSVSSAAIEDYIAVAQVFEDRGLRPRAVLIGLDPWILTAPLRNTSVALDSELQRGLRRIDMGAAAERGSLPPARSARSRYLELVSPAYFQASLAVLASGGGRLRRRASRPAEAAPEAPVDAGNLVHPDGSVDWSAREETRAPEEVARLARQHGSSPPGYLAATDLRPERRRLLQAFVSRLRRDGVPVTFWLPPYHPDAYEGLRSRGPVVAAAEAAFREIAASEGITVLGSFDPAIAGARAEDFVDAHHLRRTAALRLLRSYGSSPAGR